MRTDRVFNEVMSRKEVCDLGCPHEVVYYEIRKITHAPEDYYSKMITALHYTHDGVGTVQVAYDSQGRRYERQPYWDGWNYWVRLDDDVVFAPRASGNVKKDALGRRIDYDGNLL